MRTFEAIVVAAFGCLAGSALADGVGVRLLNDTSSDLIVTVRDLNAQPPQDVLSGEVINGNAAIDLSVTADSSAFGRLAWSATTVDRDMRRCGHREVGRVHDGSTVRVSARHRCEH